MQIEFTAKSYGALSRYPAIVNVTLSSRISLAAMARNQDNEANVEAKENKAQTGGYEYALK